MEELIQLIAKTYGIVGIILLTPTAACIFLWRHYVTVTGDSTNHGKAWADRLQALADSNAAKIEVLQQKRIDDVRALGDAVLRIAIEQAAMNKETNMLMERINETLQAVISSRP
jgi:hypothetical protein